MNPLFTILVSCLCASAITLSHAGDRDNLFDVCPTDPSRRDIFINGYPCKRPSEVSASDFKSSMFNAAGDTDNLYSSSTTLATAKEFPGLNTLGLSAARTDMEADGLVLPHTHPRASEIVFVRAGSVLAGFVDSSGSVFQKRLEKGDVFVFPRGLLHYYYNAGFEDAVVFSVLNSQNPGMASITGGVFLGNGSNAEEEVMGSLKSFAGRELDGVSVGELFGE